MEDKNKKDKDNLIWGYSKTEWVAAVVIGILYVLYKLNK